MTIFQGKTPSTFNQNHSLKHIFSTDYKGSCALLGPGNVKFKAFWLKNVRFWVANSGLFVQKKTNLSQSFISHCFSFTGLSMHSNHINTDLFDIHCMIHLVTWLACSFMIPNATFHNLKVLFFAFVLIFFFSVFLYPFNVFISYNLY